MENKQIFKEDGILSNAVGQAVGNVKTGYGSDCDPGANFVINYAYRLVRDQLDALYRQSKIYEKIVDLLPTEAGRRPIDINVNDGVTLGKRNMKAAKQRLEELNVIENFVKASKWARLYRNAYIILGIDDGQDLEQPVDWDNVRGLDWMLVRDDCDVSVHYELNVYEPEWFELTSVNTEAGARDILGEVPGNLVRIHPDRILEFTGAPLPARTKADNSGKDDSVIQRVYTDVNNYAQSIGASSAMLVRSGVALFKMAGLVDAARQNRLTELTNRFSFLNTSLSVFKSLFVDSSPDRNESVEYVNQNLAGADKIVERLLDHVVMVSGYPRSKLLGSSNSNAFSEGGESDAKEWSTCVADFQSDFWSNHANYVLRIILTALGVQDVSGISIEFAPLLVATEEEKAAVMKSHQEMFIGYMTQGILSKSEIRNALFDNEEFSTMVQRDDASLEVEQEEKMAQQEAELEMQARFSPTPATGSN